MSFDRLSSLESQPTTTRRQDDAHYRDDPEFTRLAESLSARLFELTSNISRLSNQVALLGTKRDTERVRERVHDLLEETTETFKEVGEGVKKIQSWEDVSVSQMYTLGLRRVSLILLSHPKSTLNRNSLENSKPPFKNSKQF